MKKDIRIAAIQAAIPKTTSEGENQVSRLIKAALSTPVDIVGLPEDCLVGNYNDVRNGYLPFEFLSKVARENNVYLFGATAVFEDGKLYNRGFLLSKKGDLIATHDKIVLTPTQNEVLLGTPLKFLTPNSEKWLFLYVKIPFIGTQLGFSTN